MYIIVKIFLRAFAIFISLDLLTSCTTAKLEQSTHDVMIFEKGDTFLKTLIKYIEVDKTNINEVNEVLQMNRGIKKTDKIYISSNQPNFIEYFIYPERSHELYNISSLLGYTYDSLDNKLLLTVYISKNICIPKSSIKKEFGKYVELINMADSPYLGEIYIVNKQEVEFFFNIPEVNGENCIDHIVI